MRWEDASSPAALSAALAGWRFDEAEKLVASLLEDVHETRRRVSCDVAVGVLNALRANRWFKPLDEVASALVACGQNDREVRLRLAQARIESPGGLTWAIGGLRELESELEQALEKPDLERFAKDDLTHQLGETLGLLGRAYKQFYVDARPTRAEPREHDFQLALHYYDKALQNGFGDHMWCAVNKLALETHAGRLRSGNPLDCPAADRAEQILAQVAKQEQRGPLGVWDFANRAEALVACGRYPEALEALQAYVSSPGLTLFNIGATARQFRELYGLTEDDRPGDKLLSLMTARMAELGGGGEPVDVSPAQGRRLERVLGDVSYKPLTWLQDAVARARCVARLGETPFEGMGTGFLFDGALIAEKHAGRHLLLTNAHVCSPDSKVQRRCPWPVEPTTLKATFLAARGDGEPVSVPVKQWLFTSPPDALDATLVELGGAPPEGAVAPPPAEAPPEASGDDARVNVIGHPKGLDVRVSLQDNKVVGREGPFLRYRTPTDPGSSGSPVFNQAWELVALHHAGNKGANEGILLAPLLEAMRKEEKLA